MRSTAIISDVHGNLEALEAVLREIRHQGIDEIWCLGDIVGYGPDPIACADLVRKNCSLVLMGEHEWALLNSPEGLDTLGTDMIYKTREWMRVTDASTDEDRDRWDFFSQLPLSAVVDGVFLVHGSPRAELSEAVVSSDIVCDPEKLEEIFLMIEWLCIVGHSHIPCCISEGSDLTVVAGAYSCIGLDERKHIFNVGSVGWPWDGDNRACFVAFDENAVRYTRVPYDYRRTMKKLDRLGRGYRMLGYRLSLGR